MKKSHLLAAAIGIVSIVGVSAVRAAEAKSDTFVLRGSARVEGSNGRWNQASSVPVGKWVRSDKSETTLRVPGMTVRVEPGARVRLSESQNGAARLDARGGKIYVKVDSSAPCVVSSRNKQVSASQAEFVLDAGPLENFYIVDGDAQMTDLLATPETAAKAWKKFASQVALDGPDVRQRNKNKNRRRFTQGEANKGKRLVESPIPPVETASPAYTPPVTPSVAPPSPSPPPQQPPPPQVGGNPWPWIGGILGAGGIVVLVTRRNDGDRVVNPASP
ncbi:hypothetical protein IV102_19765 [bacterium]|nr:hypothetical protein [bacterium]